MGKIWQWQGSDDLQEVEMDKRCLLVLVKLPASGQGHVVDAFMKFHPCPRDAYKVERCEMFMVSLTNSNSYSPPTCENETAPNGWMTVQLQDTSLTLPSKEHERIWRVSNLSNPFLTSEHILGVSDECSSGALVLWAAWQQELQLRA